VHRRVCSCVACRVGPSCYIEQLPGGSWRAKVAELLDEYLPGAGWDVSTEEANLGYPPDVPTMTPNMRIQAGMSAARLSVPPVCPAASLGTARPWVSDDVAGQVRR
jgi:hypothetical protein